MELRACLVALPLLLVSGMALAGSDAFQPEYKACVARAADKADAALNQAYKALQDKIRSAAKEMGQGPDVQLNDLKDSQKQWIAYRDGNCTLEDSLAFGGTAIGGNYLSGLRAHQEGGAWPGVRAADESTIRPLKRLKPAKKPVY